LKLDKIAPGESKYSRFLQGGPPDPVISRVVTAFIGVK